MDSGLETRAREVIHYTVPDSPHPGFYERHGPLAHQLQRHLLGALAVTPELDNQVGASFQTRLEAAGNQYKKELTTYNAVRSLDNYLHNHTWQYPGERQEEHQEEVLHNILVGISNGHTEGHNEGATSTGKNYEIAKLTEAFYLGGMRTLVVSPTTASAYVNLGKTVNGIPEKGLAQFAPNILPRDIGRHFDQSRAKPRHRVVVSTYQSLLNFAESGELGEFDVILADEAHRSLGAKTAEAMKSFSPHAIKIGFTATPRYGINKSVDEIFPYRYHLLPLAEAIEKGLTAAVQPLVYTTDVEIPNFDPRFPDFTPRELSRLATLKSRNELAVQLVKNLVEEGRQGFVPCLPGKNLAHARLMADLIGQQIITDAKTGQARPIVVRAVGNFIGEQLEPILEAFERGEIDVLTYVKILTEAVDSQVASFLVNTCPTTSLVKITQDLGRIIRRKTNGPHSIAIDIVDRAVGKEQKTVLHALGQETVELGKIYSSEKASLPSDTRTYLRGILEPSLYAQLERVDGMLLRDLTLQPHRQVTLQERYEQRLANDGLALNPHVMDIPPELLSVVRAYEDNHLAQFGTSPDKEQIVAYLMELDATTLGIAKKDAQLTIEQALDVRDIEKVGLLPDIAGQMNNGIEDNLDNALMSVLSTRQGALTIALASLDDRERAIVASRHGYYDGKPRSLMEIGEAYGLTTERIRQIESRARAKLRSLEHVDLQAFWRQLPEVSAVEKQHHYSPSIIDEAKFNEWIGGLRPQPKPLIPLRFIYPPYTLSLEDLRAQTDYMGELHHTVQEVYKYADIAEPIIKTIAISIHGAIKTPHYVSLGEEVTYTRSVIQQGLSTQVTSAGKIVERQETHNNWALKQKCLIRFESELFDTLSSITAYIKTFEQVIIKDRPPLGGSEKLIQLWAIKLQARNLLIDKLRQTVDDVLGE